MAHPVSFFQIQGSDSRGLIKFYQKAFGWHGSAGPDGGLMITPEAGGIPGAIGPSSDGSAHLAVYIRVDDVTKHLLRAKRAGARVVMQETRLPANLGSIGGIIDPAGNWVGLWAAPPTPSITNGKTGERSGARSRAQRSRANASQTKPTRRPAAKKPAPKPKAKAKAKPKAKAKARAKAKTRAKRRG